MHRLFVLFSLLAASFAHAKDVPFQATSVGTSFAIAGELSGTFDVDRDKVTIDISNGHLIRQPCPYTGERKVKEIREFLASWTKDKRTFNVYAYSAPIKIEKSISLGKIIPLEPGKLEIPVKGLKKDQVENSWLGFSISDETLNEQGEPQGGTCDIHDVTSLAGAVTGFPAKREMEASGELQALERALAPAMADLKPRPSVYFLPTERMMHADSRAKYFKVSDSSYSGRALIAPRYEFGPENTGFVLTAQMQDAGSPNSLTDLATPKGMDWKTDIGTSPVAGSPKQVSWSLSYGANLDPAVLAKLRQGLQNLTAAAE